MVNQVQLLKTTNGATVQQAPTFATQSQYKTTPIPEDKFEKKDGKKGLTGLEKFLGVTTAGFAVTTAVCSKNLHNISKSLGNCLKRLGKDIPNGTTEKLSVVMDKALKDELTGLYNRACLNSFVKKCFNEAKNANKNLAVGFIDMDNFKCFNEVFDHDKGDKVLQAMSKNIQKVSEKYDVKCFRYGGEEFVMVAPGHDAKSIQKILTEINDEIKNDKYINGLLPEFLEKAVKSKVSLGIVTKELDSSVTGSIFARLKQKRNLKKDIILKNDILNLVKNYIKEFKLNDNKNHAAIIKKLTQTPDEKLKSVLNVNSKIFDDLTLGKALDEIYTTSKNNLNDLDKGLSHIKEHKNFTCSGGGADLKSNPTVKDGLKLVGLADNRVKAAKANGKNRILI